MNGGKVIVVFVGLVLALWVVVQALTGGWNAISQTFKYIGIGMVIASFFLPRFGFWLVVLSMGYLDYLKRLLVMGDITTILDVTIILAFTPLLVFAIAGGILLRDFLTSQFTMEQLKLVALVGLLGFFAAFAVFVGGLGGGGIGKLKAAANYGGYIPLIYIVPRLFNSPEKVLRMVKTMVVMFIPIGLYTFKQYIFGFTWWEIEYLKTGLSVEYRILDGQDFRYFSTLNSSQNLAKVASMLGALSLMIVWSKKHPIVSLAIALALFLMFFSAAFLSGSRTGIVMGVVAIGVYFCCRYRFLTVACYASGLALFLTAIIASDYMIREKTLNNWSEDLQRTFGGNVDERRLNLATFTIRLEGFANLKDPEFWQPFGVARENRSKFELHDAFTRLLVRIGFVPMSVLLLGVGLFLWKLHSSVFKYEAGRKLKLMGMAILLCILVGGLSASQNLSTFPINAFLYIFSGIVVVGFAQQRIRYVERTAEEVQVGEAPLGGRPVRLQ